MSSLIPVQVAGTAQPLTPQQKKFSTLMQRIARQRELLQQWDAAILAFRQRHAAQWLPLEQEERQLKVQLLQRLDRLSDQTLAKAERAHVQEVIRAFVDELLPHAGNESERDALKAIYNRHAQQDYDSEQKAIAQAQDAVARAMARQGLGVELSAQAQATAPLHEPHERAHAAQRKPAARELRAQAEKKQTSQSVREIYRKLASSLHPDRETNPAERERKTALMQRANQAYKAGNLPALLQLQLEMEQIDAQHMAGLSEERLRHYNRVLDGQCRELEQEMQRLCTSFFCAYGLSPFAHHTPKNIGALLMKNLQALAARNGALRRVQQQLAGDPASFTHWLRNSRAQQRQRGQVDGDGDGMEVRW